jgi:DNA replication and repair protein RecF
MRSLVLALKIFELKLIENARGQKPIFLLDDVFSELDGARRHALVDYLKGHQTIITTTDADAIIEHFTDANKIIPLS